MSADLTDINMAKLFFTYLPYGVIDLFLTLAIILEITHHRYDLIWANIPVLIWGMVSLSKALGRSKSDLAD